MLQVGLEIIATIYRATIVKIHVLRLYSHLCIYVSMYLCIYIVTHLHTIYLDWLQVVLESNSRCAWKRGSIELRGTLRPRDRASMWMHLEAMIV